MTRSQILSTVQLGLGAGGIRLFLVRLRFTWLLLVVFLSVVACNSDASSPQKSVPPSPVVSPPTATSLVVPPTATAMAGQSVEIVIPPKARIGKGRAPYLTAYQALGFQGSFETTIGGEPVLYRHSPDGKASLILTGPSDNLIEAMVMVDSNSQASDQLTTLIRVSDPAWAEEGSTWLAHSIATTSASHSDRIQHGALIYHFYYQDGSVTFGVSPIAN